MQPDEQCRCQGIQLVRLQNHTTQSLTLSSPSDEGSLHSDILWTNCATPITYRSAHHHQDDARVSLQLTLCSSRPHPYPRKPGLPRLWHWCWIRPKTPNEFMISATRWTNTIQEKTITGGVGSLSNKEHKCHGLSWSWAATHRCHKLTEENHDGGVYPVRRVRRRVALNPWVSPEVAFSDLVKWLAHERLENLLWRACDTL